MNELENTLTQAAKLSKTESHILSKEEATQYINCVLSKFSPQKTSGHLAIDNDSFSLPVEEYEFTYSNYLPQEPAFIFFDQQGINKNLVFKISNAQKLGFILKECYGIEYFLSNETFDYLIAVNWYAIEGCGNALQWLASLRTSS